MRWNIILKELIKEAIEHFAKAEIRMETGLQIVEKRLDIQIINFKECKAVLPENSWIEFLWRHRSRFMILELKTPTTIINSAMVRQIMDYKLILAIAKKIKYTIPEAFLIAGRIPKSLAKRLRKDIFNNLGIESRGPFYTITGNEILRVHMISIEELDPEVPGNEVLCLLAKDEVKSFIAAKRIIERYKADTFIYAFTVVYKPEVSGMAKTELIKKDTLRQAIEAIGVEKTIDAIGLRRVIEAIGVEKTIDAIGIDRLVKALNPKDATELFKALLKVLPRETLRELLKDLEEVK